MVAFADLLAAQPDIWREQATAWLRLGQQLDDRSGDLHGHVGRLRAVWHGKDADAATAHGGQLVTSWRQRSAEALHCGQVLREFADRADIAQRRANATIRAAFPTYLVAADGTVTVDPILEARTFLVPVERVALETGATRLAAELTEILDEVSAADAAATRQLSQVRSDAIALAAAMAGVTAASAPPPRRPPAARPRRRPGGVA